MVGELRLQVEPTEAWHQRITLDDTLRILAALWVRARHIEACNLVFLAINLLLLVEEQTDYPRILLALAYDNLGILRKVRLVYTEGLQDPSRCGVTLARSLTLLFLLLRLRRQHH